MDEKEDSSTNISTAKYSIVLRFWNTPQEIEVDELVSCQNIFTHGFYYKFIDSTGRLWDNVPESDVIIIKNYPDKKDMDDFLRIKKETDELGKKLMQPKQSHIDVNIG